MRHAEHGSGGKTFFDRFHDRWMAMPGHQRSETEVMVDVFVAVKITEAAALTFGDKDRIRIVSTVVAGHA